METSLGFYTLAVVFIIVVFFGFRFPSIRNVLLLAFLVRMGLLIFNNYVTPLSASGFDAETFEKVGWFWAQDGISGIPQHFTTGAPLYSWFISIIYILLDRSPMMIQGINVLFGVSNILLAYNLSLALNADSKIAKRVVWAVSFFPTALLFSIMILREEMTVFLLLLNTLCFLFFLEKPRIRFLVVISATLLILVALHTAFIILPVFFLLVLVSRLKKNEGGIRGGIIFTVALLCITGILFFILHTGWGMQKAGQGDILDVEMYGKQQQIAARDRAAYLPDSRMESTADLFLQLPIRMIYFLFSPFVWQLKEGKDMLGALDGVIYLLMVIMIMTGLRKISENEKAKILFFLSGIIVSVFSLVTSNYGTAIRHRFKVSALLIILFMMAAENKKQIRIKW